MHNLETDLERKDVLGICLLLNYYVIISDFFHDLSLLVFYC